MFSRNEHCNAILRLAHRCSQQAQAAFRYTYLHVIRSTVRSSHSRNTKYNNTYNTLNNSATSKPGPPHCRGFTVTLRHSTLGRAPLDEWSVRRRDLYLTTSNTHKKQTSIPSAGFEPAIQASERPQTHPFDRAATGIGRTALLLGNDVNAPRYGKSQNNNKRRN